MIGAEKQEHPANAYTATALINRLNSEYGCITGRII